MPSSLPISVLLVYPPSLDFMVAFLACLKAGVIAVPVFPPHPVRRDTLQQFCTICEACGASCALTNTEYQYAKKLAGIKQTFVKFSKHQRAAIGSNWPEHLQWIVTNGEKPSKRKSKLELPVITDRSQTAFLQFTSGSTSAPKGVMITHGNLAHNLTCITSELDASDGTVVVSWLPQYHDMGLIGSYLGTLYCAGSGYYMSPLAFLQRPMLWLEAVSKYKATHLQAPNFAFRLTARKFSAEDYSNSSAKNKFQLDLSTVRHVINAAEPVDAESIETFYKTFEPFRITRGVIFPTYGLAEHTVFVCSGGKQILALDKHELEVNGKVVVLQNDGAKSKKNAVSRSVGCGYPARQGITVKIVDAETCQELPNGQVGEVWVTSESKAAGYYHKPEETKRDFNAVLSGNQNGKGTLEFLRTGDLGFLNERELFICGRLKDLIIVGGRNYYPQDLEATAEVSISDSCRPGCTAAFTVNPIQESRENGEQVILIMELKEVPSSNNADSICLSLVNTVRSAINQQHSLAIAEVLLIKPRTVPKTSSGKIARAWCRKAYVKNTLQVVYRKSFKAAATNNSSMASLEIESDQPSKSPATPANDVDIDTIRAMAKKDLLQRLTQDLSSVSGIPVEQIEPKAALITMMDSISIAQLKGLIESKYAVQKLSDEYLFQESTNLNKIVEIVKLGHAPDDDHENGEGVPVTTAPPPMGQAKGLAGALGCPPGVRCTIM